MNNEQTQQFDQSLSDNLDYEKARKGGGLELLRYEAKNKLVIEGWSGKITFLRANVPCYPCPIGWLYYRVECWAVYIDYVHTHPDAQRCGVGKQLHDYLRKQYPSHVFKTGESTVEGRKFIFSLGYTPADNGGYELADYKGKLKFGYADGEWVAINEINQTSFTLVQQVLSETHYEGWRITSPSFTEHFETTFNLARKWCEEWLQRNRL